MSLVFRVLLRSIVTGLLMVRTTAYGAVNDIFGAENLALDILKGVADMLIALAIMLFFWGLVKFIAHASDSKEHEEGKRFIVWGLVSLLVVFSLWALVGLILSGLGITGGNIPYINSDGS